MVDEADFIVTALPVQKAELSIAYPEAARKIAPVREVAAWDDYLLSEDPHGLPHDNTFWDYVEENPGYVAKTMAEAEQMLIRAYPHILERLLAKKP
jgi:hypothetical protein